MSKTLFLEESGTHDLVNIDAEYPMLVLGGVIVENAYIPTMEEAVRAFKQEVFGRSDLILHTADIARNKNGFEELKDPMFRQRFYNRLNDLMRTLEYKVIACAIKTDEHRRRYVNPVDPYMYGLEILIERFCREMGTTGRGGKIIAEKRRPDLDHQLLLACNTGKNTEPTIARRIASSRILTTSNRGGSVTTLSDCNSPIWSYHLSVVSSSVSRQKRISESSRASSASGRAGNIGGMDW